VLIFVTLKERSALLGQGVYCPLLFHSSNDFDVDGDMRRWFIDPSEETVARFRAQLVEAVFAPVRDESFAQSLKSAFCLDHDDMFTVMIGPLQEDRDYPLFHPDLHFCLFSGFGVIFLTLHCHRKK